MKKSVKILALILAWACALLSACEDRDNTPYIDPTQKVSIDLSPQTKSRTAEVHLGIGSVITPQEGYNYYYRLVEYLEKHLEMPVSVIDRGNYKEFNELLAHGELDIAFVCGGPYVKGKKDFNLQLLVVPETLSGETIYYSYLIVPFDSPAQKLEDLEGKRFAFTDPQSNSGKLVPTYLLAQLGKNPDTFFKKTIYTYAHDKSIYAVAEKKVDAAAVDSLIYNFMVEKYPELKSRTRILAISEPYGIPPVVVRPGLSEELRQRLRNILVKMDKDVEGRDILEGMKIRRFVDSNDSAYDSIRNIEAFFGQQPQSIREK